VLGGLKIKLNSAHLKLELGLSLAIIASAIATSNDEAKAHLFSSFSFSS
jgi:hypothetical protein